MRKKFSAKKSLLFLFVLFLSSMLYAGGVLLSPRKAYVIKTNYFNIIFPKESAETAKKIAEVADSLYNQAKSEIGLKKDYLIPVLISPDSSVLEVKYTSRPYNRIVIYDAVPDASQIIFGSGDILLNLFYKEIFRALSSSVRSPFNEFVYRVLEGDLYQPVALINLPFSFVEAYADIADGCRNDGYYQQLLIQAKIENKFPGWLQATAMRDIHPGDDLPYAAASGFAAFLMNSRGLEKYCEFWEECGKLHPYFLNGIFYKIYGQPLYEVWKEFKDSVPLPPEMERVAGLEFMSQEVSKNDRQGAFENILYTNFGVVWYDSIRHEVDIFDSNNSFKIRQLLFIADDIKKLSLSPNGRYISASFTREIARPEFKEDVTRIFDLKQRKFLDYKFMLRDAAFIQAADGSTLLAGISVQNKNPVLKVYAFNETEKTEEDLIELYERSFEKTTSIFSLSGAGPGKLSYLLADEKAARLAVEDLENSQVQSWLLSDEAGNEIEPFFINFIPQLSIFTFSYFPKEEGALVRSGYITLSEDTFELQEVFIQDCDISGGVYYPVIAADNLYYCARKFSHNELRYLSRDLVPFNQGQIKMQEEELAQGLVDTEIINQVASEKKLGDFNLKVYNPFKYMLHVSFTPLLAIRDITVDKGPVFWPSLGMYASTNADPMRNTDIILSGGLDFLLLYFEKEFNTVPKEKQTLIDQGFGRNKKFNFAAYVENSSTPVDIAAGGLFKFNGSGEYDFKALAKTAWTLPIGNILRNINFSISSIYLASTEYYDSNKIEYHPPKEGWTAPRDAYELLELSLAATYSNSHQYGISRYERRGLTIGGRIYSMWDIYEINLLKDYKNQKEEEINSGTNSELTEAQLSDFYKENMINVSQLNLGIITTIEIPRLTPLEIKNGWVLSVPSVIHAEFLNRTGTVLEASVESLLIGNEIQNGFPFLYLFFSRMGLKGGYGFTLDYDTTKVHLPDLRQKKYIADAFAQATFSDRLFMILNTDFLIPTGKLSEVQFNMNLKGEYFIKTNGFKISLNVSSVF